MGSEFYRRCLKWYTDKGDGPGAKLFHDVWDGTPWTLDAFTDRVGSDRYSAIRIWCLERLGPPAWPLHGVPGDWQFGTVTFHGWTWIGFSTEAMMLEFQAAWPDPEEVDRELRE